MGFIHPEHPDPLFPLEACVASSQIWSVMLALSKNQSLPIMVLFKVVDYGELLCLTFVTHQPLKSLGGVFPHPAGSGCLNVLIQHNLYGNKFLS